ncbi:hypothetical protein ANO11243_087760 [Dothideomycetidae sp. 11243]|nr:hypothetical protein ANO11243_087760 [fungal sp. No.11243]
MVLKTIYVVRHGFRSNWVVNPSTGEYTHNFPTPTGIPSDPSLASHGVEQATELASHLCYLTPPVDAIYSSPFYRCIQTLAPTLSQLNSRREKSSRLRIRLDTGLAEFYGLARFDHPRPATLDVLQKHFPNALDDTYRESSIESSKSGESIGTLHDRVAYAIHKIIERADADGTETILLCTHAAVMICLGRVLTGNMPPLESDDDFKCATCSFSKFLWDSEKPEHVPDVNWKGHGVQGRWECEVNGDCSFLTEGEERGWSFAMDETNLDPQLCVCTSNNQRRYHENH